MSNGQAVETQESGLCGRPSQTGTCGQRAGAGTPHFGHGPCKWHGGALPNVIKHHAQVMAQEELTKLGYPIEVDPTAALLGALYEAEGHAVYLRLKLEEEQGLTQHSDKLGDSPSVWKTLWDNERDRAAKLAKACIDAGIAERQVQIAEHQAEMLVAVIRRVLDDPDLRLSTEQREVADRAVPLALRAVAG